MQGESDHAQSMEMLMIFNQELATFIKVSKLCRHFLLRMKLGKNLEKPEAFI